jgi:hypothetical protein
MMRDGLAFVLVGCLLGSCATHSPPPADAPPLSPATAFDPVRYCDDSVKSHPEQDLGAPPGIVRMPQILREGPPPPFPGREGVVTFRIRIDETGAVSNIDTISSADAELGALAKTALWGLHFKPACRSDGRPAVFHTLYKYKFELPR